MRAGTLAVMLTPPRSTLPGEEFSPAHATIMKARVIVMPKQAVLDPQGVAVRDAIHHLGLPAASEVRVGKFMEIEIDGTAPGDRAALEARLHALCRDLLSNPVIEDYRLELDAR